jgi:hypothetical protein
MEVDPRALIDAGTPSALPAPFWFVQVFKVLGFTLHAVPMNLWYAGIVVAMVLYARGGEQGKQFSRRLMLQMPVIIAFGINFGIVPLLFVQAAYFRAFYSATILTAWFWLAIIMILIPAYYAVYVYTLGLREEAQATAGEQQRARVGAQQSGARDQGTGTGGPASGPRALGLDASAPRPGSSMTPLVRAAGWAAAVLFLLIGFLYANGFSLMANVKGWPELWLKTNFGGAALGTALNVADASLWPRWLMMFGLAITTTAAWVAVDAALFARKESPAYQSWARHFAWKLYTVGLVWFAVAGTWYLLTWPDHLRATLLGWPWETPLVVLTIVTAAAPGLPWLLLFVSRQRSGKADGPVNRSMASLIGLAQFGVLGINAISRQVAQNVELLHYDAVARTEAVQWSPLVAFLVVLVIGLAVVAWMIAQVLKTQRVVGVG